MSDGAEQAVILGMVAAMLLCLFVGSVLSDDVWAVRWLKLAYLPLAGFVASVVILSAT